MKKIVVYNKSFFPVSQTFVHQQISIIKDAFTIVLLGQKQVNPGQFDLEGVRMKLINEPGSFVNNLYNKVLRRLGIHVGLNESNSWKIESFLRHEQPDLIHVHFGYNAVDILPIVQKLNIPLIVTFHGYDAAPMIKTKRAYLKTLPGLLAYAAKILLVSDHMTEVLPLTEEQKQKVVIFPCPVDVDYFKDNTDARKCDKVRILHSGRLVQKKGVLDLVEVFGKIQEQNPDSRLDIVGDGPELEKIREKILNLKLQNSVFVHGSQSHAAVRQFLSQCEIFVLNSRIAEDGDMEGSPVSILEAMSMGKAVISTRHAGIPDIIRHRSNGILVNERDSESLKHSITELIQDAAWRNSLGLNARETVEARFSLPVARRRLMEIYSSVLDKTDMARDA